MRGFLVAAPSSGSGKTTVTLGLLKALVDRGVVVATAKAGPDYIDPAFQALASRGECINLDPWAMRPAYMEGLAAGQGSGKLLVVEAMMGLFDGAADGKGSAADLAELLGLPVVFVVDCSRMSQSVAALVEGYRNHRKGVHVAGVILNRVGSERHERMLRAALAPSGIEVFGVVPNIRELALPSRHLGLVQAGEHAEIETLIARAGAFMAQHIDLDRLQDIAGGRITGNSFAAPLPPLGQRIAVARDEAFSFAYPHMLNGWREAGAEIRFFSPLGDEAAAPDCDAVFLPGGYPELHAGKIAGASQFKQSLAEAAKRGAVVYGECGGYMVLGEGLTDGDGVCHKMAGLLALETSYATPKRHLGYRRMRPLGNGLPWDFPLTGHEFHYSVATRESGQSLFSVSDAEGNDLGHHGLVAGRVVGSYLHVIDRGEP